MEDGGTQFERLYAETASAVWAYIRRHTRDATAAEDVLQETYLAAWRRPDAIAAAISPRAWLLGIARNLVRSSRRRSGARTTLPLGSEPPAPGPPQRNDRLDQVREAIERLPEREREALQLRLAHELRYEEIASVLNVPIGTVRSRLHSAVRRLREQCGAVEPAKLSGVSRGNDVSRRGVPDGR